MHIEIWSDFVCPFCYVGKKRFETALDSFSHRDDVEVSFKSFQLDPNTPKYNGKSYHENLAQKFGTIEQAKQMTENMQEQAKTVGMEFDFDHVKVANTLDAHRLNKLAQEEQVQKELSEQLFRGHFIEGKDLGDKTDLLSIAHKAGLDEAKAEKVLDDDEPFYVAVQADIAEAKQFGVSSVPTFIINRKYAISGGQPVEAFTQAMEKVWEEENEQSPLQDLSSTTEAGDACGSDGCAVPEKEE